MTAYPSGTIIPGIGTSDLAVATQSEKCRTLVKQGFALMHCFWFNEAVRSLRNAVKEDPECAIAWCGLNISLTLPWNKRQQFNAEAEYAIKQAVRLAETAGPVEKGLIAAFRSRQLDKDDRKGAFNTGMTDLIERFPEADEPRLLLAGIRAQICMFDRTLPSGEVQNELVEVAKLIEPVLKRDPKNPGALHYHIHAYEGSTPETALPSARLIGQVAPSSAHMVHMAGHIYNVIGMFAEADKAFSDANTIGEAYAKEVGASPGAADWNYGHNRDYWSVNLGEQGRLKEAFGLTTFGGRRSEIYWRVGAWDKLLETVKESKGGEPSYYRGLALAHQGNLSGANECLANLKAIDAGSYGTVAKRVHETRLNELGGMCAVKGGDVEAGLTQLRQALETFAKVEYEEPPYFMRPPHETLIDCLISLGRTDEALSVCEAALKVKRNAGTIQFLVGRAHEAAKDDAKAKTAYETFLANWSKADDELAQVKHAKSFLATRATRSSQ